MALASGLSLEAQAASATVTPGATLRVNITAFGRSPAQVTLTGVKLTGMEGAPALNLAPVVLVNNQPSNYTLNVRVPDNQPYSQPYWLEQPKDGNLYSVRDPRNIGTPENAPVLEAHFTVKIAGTDLDTDPAGAESLYAIRCTENLVRPLAVVPPVAVDLDRTLAGVRGHASRARSRCRCDRMPGKPSGEAHLEVPAGWKVEPATQHFDLAGAGEQTTVAFDLTPPAAAARGTVRAVAMVGGRSISSGHGGHSVSAFPGADFVSAGGGIAGARRYQESVEKYRLCDGRGRRSSGFLRQIGCDVTLLAREDLSHGDLSRYDAIVTGVRAWNTRADLARELSAPVRLRIERRNGGGGVLPAGRRPGRCGGGRRARRRQLACERRRQRTRLRGVRRIAGRAAGAEARSRSAAAAGASERRASRRRRDTSAARAVPWQPIWSMRPDRSSTSGRIRFTSATTA